MTGATGAVTRSALVRRATAAQNAHRTALRETLQSNGQAPIDDADIEIVFPADACDRRRGAVTTIQDQTTREPFAQLAASESERPAFLKGLAGRVVIDPVPSVHGIATTADEFTRYTP